MQIQRAISCVNAHAHVLTAPPDHSGVYALTVSHGESFPLRAPTPLALNVRMQYRVMQLAPQAYRLHTVADAYALEDADTTLELFAYHWHPETRYSVSFPHLHISAASGKLRAEYDRAHFDTGRITLEAVVRLIVRDFGVQPVRDDWETILAAMRVSFNAAQDWSR